MHPFAPGADAPVVVVLTGIVAAGKSTVGALLAARFGRAAHVRGDLFQRMIVCGQAEIRPGLGP
jgi:dephospho-CoA kinase